MEIDCNLKMAQQMVTPTNQDCERRVQGVHRTQARA